jgi:hypothetical protein
MLVRASAAIIRLSSVAALWQAVSGALLWSSWGQPQESQLRYAWPPHHLLSGDDMHVASLDLLSGQRLQLTQDTLRQATC